MLKDKPVTACNQLEEQDPSDFVEKFWEKWYNSTDRIQVLKQTALRDFAKEMISGKGTKLDKAMEHGFYLLINSFLEDLMSWTHTKRIKGQRKGKRSE